MAQEHQKGTCQLIGEDSLKGCQMEVDLMRSTEMRPNGGRFNAELRKDAKWMKIYRTDVKLMDADSMH